MGVTGPRYGQTLPRDHTQRQKMVLLTRLLSPWLLRPRVLIALLFGPGAPHPWKYRRRAYSLAARLTRPLACAAWNGPERIDRIIEHHRIVHGYGGVIGTAFAGPRTLSSLAALGSGYSVTIDEPLFLIPDGLLSLTFRQQDRPLFWLTMMLGTYEGKRTAFFTGLQGHSSDWVIELFRSMTKELHGLRPRDLIIYIAQEICACLGIERIHAVTERSRHQFTPGARNPDLRPMSFNYDEAWRDRGGVPLDQDWFVLPIQAERRSIEAIPARKRALYRKRYEMLDLLDKELVQDMAAHGYRGQLRRTDLQCPAHAAPFPG